MGRWYGSLDNRLAEGARFNGDVKVGTLCTELMYSDRTPYEVIEVIDARHVIARRLDWKRSDSNGMSDMQEYTYTSNEKNSTANLFLTKDGRWVQRYGNRGYGNVFAMGYAERYFDFTF